MERLRSQGRRCRSGKTRAGSQGVWERGMLAGEGGGRGCWRRRRPADATQEQSAAAALGRCDQTWRELVWSSRPLEQTAGLDTHNTRRTLPPWTFTGISGRALNPGLTGSHPNLLLSLNLLTFHSAQLSLPEECNRVFSSPTSN